MLLSLCRVRRAGRTLFPEHSRTWIFPAASVAGHLTEYKEPRERLSAWGGSLRQTYATAGALIGLTELQLKILLNHTLAQSVTSGYVTRAALLGPLRECQERVSRELLRWCKIAD